MDPGGGGGGVEPGGPAACRQTTVVVGDGHFFTEDFAGCYQVQPEYPMAAHTAGCTPHAQQLAASVQQFR